jgi:hypothetical protein
MTQVSTYITFKFHVYKIINCGSILMVIWVSFDMIPKYRDDLWTVFGGLSTFSALYWIAGSYRKRILGKKGL